MRKMIAAVLALGTLVISGQAFASDQTTCPANTKLQLVGVIKTGTSVFGENADGDQDGTSPTVTTAGVNVRRIIGRCGGTACVVGLADVDRIGSAVLADYKIEPGAPANTVFDLEFESGLQFNEGISVNDTTGNVQSLSIFECR